MKYMFDSDDNFLRVFELPLYLPTDYCMQGGINTSFTLVDWFQPFPVLATGESHVVEHDEAVAQIADFIRQKKYVKPGKKYLVLTDFGCAFTFKGG